jgi:hypothetical protein
LKNVEDMEGNSKCVKFLEQLKINNVSQKNVSQKNVERTTRAPGAIMSDSEESEFGADPAAEEAMETEEAILERAVALDTPAAAKKAAAQLIAAKKQARCQEKSTPPQTVPTAAANSPTPTEAVQTGQPSQPTKPKTEIWKTVKPRSNANTPTKLAEPERACWLYIHNNVSRDIQTRRYMGDRE